MLAATRDLGTPTGPGLEAEIDLNASESFCEAMALIMALQDDNADVVACDSAGRARPT